MRSLSPLSSTPKVSSQTMSSRPHSHRGWFPLRPVIAAACIVLPALLAGCSGDYNVAQVRSLDTQGGTYFLALQQGYADVAQWKQEEQNWDDSERMLAKARTAAGGAIPTLEEAPTPALEKIRDHLSTVLSAQTVAKHPIDAALAQVAYDCVALTAVNPPDPNGTSSHNCRTMLDEALANLGQGGAGVSSPSALTIGFSNGSSALSGKDRQTLADLATTLVETPPQEIIIKSVGMGKGSKRSNAIVLAQKRVTAVYLALLKKGVNEDLIRQVVYSSDTAPHEFQTAKAQNQVSVDIVR